jgi:hypothetical protein
MNSYIPAIITASVALIAAVGAQFLSHILTARREKIKDNKTIYQEYISPFLNEVLFYFETETDWRKGHDVERTIDGDGLVEQLSDKIKYGDPNLLNSIYKYTSSITFFDGRGEAKNINKLKTFFWYLNYSSQIIQNLKLENRELIEKINYTSKMYGIWAILTDLYGFYSATKFLSWKWAWEYKDFLNSLPMENLRNIINRDTGYKYLTNELLESMKREMVRSNELLPQDILDIITISDG